MSNLFSQFSGFNPIQTKNSDTITCPFDYCQGNGELTEFDRKTIDFEDSITLFGNDQAKGFEFSFDDDEEYGGFSAEG